MLKRKSIWFDDIIKKSRIQQESVFGIFLWIMSGTAALKNPSENLSQAGFSLKCYRNDRTLSNLAPEIDNAAVKSSTVLYNGKSQSRAAGFL